MDAAFAQINPYNGRLRNCFAQNKRKIVSELKQLFSGENTGEEKSNGVVTEYKPFECEEKWAHN